MALNVFAVITAPPFKLLPRYLFGVYLLISLVVTYRFLYNFKAYSVFEFEDLYAYMKKKTSVQMDKLRTKKRQDPQGYFYSIIVYLSETFAGVHFEYKMQKRIYDSQAYLDK